MLQHRHFSAQAITEDERMTWRRAWDGNMSPLGRKSQFIRRYHDLRADPVQVC